MDGPEERLDPLEGLRALRWDVDSLVVNAFGEKVWLKAAFDEQGKRIGITDCCFDVRPCEHHASISARGMN